MTDTPEGLLRGRVEDILPTLPDCSVDAIVGDPPYGLEFMGQEWDSFKPSQGKWGDREHEATIESKDDTPHHRAAVKQPSVLQRCSTCGGNSSGQWNRCHCESPSFRSTVWPMHAFQEWCYGWSVELHRVVKPGGWVLLFGGTRTWHRLACALEDAGFEMRDTIIAWTYATGFPKSHDVSKALDKAAGAERDVLGVRRYVDGSEGHWATSDKYAQDSHTTALAAERAIKLDTAPATHLAKRFDGYGTALKPSWEPVLVARKPLIGTVAQNVERWGVGGINVDGCRIEYASDDLAERTARTGANAGRAYGATNGVAMSGGELAPPNVAGRWPTNTVLCHHPSCTEDDCVEGCHVATLDEQSGRRGPDFRGTARPQRTGLAGTIGGWAGYGGGGREVQPSDAEDGGAASRFYPCFRFEAKADSAERPVGEDGAGHPTVKPLSLIRFLVRLVSPPDGGLILDPFLGSGTTAEACINENVRWVGIERDERYWPLIEQRVSRAERGADPSILAKAKRVRDAAEAAGQESLW